MVLLVDLLVLVGKCYIASENKKRKASCLFFPIECVQSATFLFLGFDSVIDLVDSLMCLSLEIFIHGIVGIQLGVLLRSSLAVKQADGAWPFLLICM